MTWGFASYETRFRWMAAIWAIALTAWCMCHAIPWPIRLIGGVVWVVITILGSLSVAWWRPRSARDVPIFIAAEGVTDAPFPTQDASRTFTPAGLKALIRALTVAGYRFQTVSEAIAAPDRKSVVLTFTGATRDCFLTLLPILRETNTKATCFLPTPTHDDPSRLRALEVQEMARSGLIEIGGMLTPEALQQDDNAVVEAIEQNRRLLTGIVRTLPVVFAYPKGTDVERVAPLVQRAGYVWAVGNGTDLQPVSAAPLNIARRVIPRNLRPWQAYLVATRGRWHV